MHTQPMKESDGKFTQEEKSERSCRKCNNYNVTYQVWESNCGGYEDYKYTCQDCKATWWVDGIDS